MSSTERVAGVYAGRRAVLSRRVSRAKVKLGAPNREHFGLTVAADGKHRLWFDRPDSGMTWEL